MPASMCSRMPLAAVNAPCRGASVTEMLGEADGSKLEPVANHDDSADRVEPHWRHQLIDATASICLLHGRRRFVAPPACLL